jgi:hypothetical protein
VAREACTREHPEPHHGPCDGAEVEGGRATSIAAYREAADLQPVQHCARAVGIQRREREAPVAQDLHQRAAGGDHDQRAEVGIRHQPERQLDPWLRHGGHRHLRAEATGQLPVGRGQLAGVGEPEPHAPGPGLVGDATDGGLERDRPAEAAGRGHGLLDGGGAGGGDHRDAIVDEQRQALGLGQRLAVLQARAIAPARRAGRAWAAAAGAGALVPVVEQVPDGRQAGGGPFQHRHAAVADDGGVARVDRAC